MTIKLDDIMAALPTQRRARIEGRVMELATLKVLRKAAEAPRKDLSAVLDVAPSVFSRWANAGSCSFGVSTVIGPFLAKNMTPRTTCWLRSRSTVGPSTV